MTDVEYIPRAEWVYRLIAVLDHHYPPPHEAANVLEDMAVIATELADYLSYRDGLMLPPRLQIIVNEWRKV